MEASISKIKKSLIYLFGFVVLTLFFTSQVQATTVSNLVTFDDTSDLSNLFNQNVGGSFTDIGFSGINNSGSVNIPIGSNAILTTKQGYSVYGKGDVYTFSAYFKIKVNAGYGGLGFSSSDTNSTDSFGSPEKGIGVMFHGGGGAFVNNRVNTNVSWIQDVGDLVLGNWYKMIFTVTAKGSNSYDLNLQIWNSDANGILGTLFTEQSLNNVVNNDLGGASIIHGYFSAAGSRMEKIDNFLINLEGGASFIEEGMPVVLTNETVVSISDSSIQLSGNITDEQGSAVIDKGFCWDTNTLPTIENNCISNGPGSGAYVSNITGLAAETTYYARAYATNVVGTSYGVEKTFTSNGSQSTSSVSSNSNFSSPGAPSCNDAKPASVPDLFQLDATSTSAKLFFTPISNTSQFYVSFSENTNAEEHGELVTLLREGVQSHTIYYLKPNTSYYLKVRGQNGCMPGEWSRILKIKTNSKNQTKQNVFYKYIDFINKIISPFQKF